MIQFYKPTIKRKDMDSVLQTMVNEQIGPGERAKAFVQSFCETIGATSGVAFRTYPDCLSSALELARSKVNAKAAAERKAMRDSGIADSGTAGARRPEEATAEDTTAEESTSEERPSEPEQARRTRVAVSPLSPSIYSSVIRDCGMEMVIVDIDRETGCPDENLVAQSGADILLLYENLGTLPVKYNEETTFAEACDYGAVKVIEDISQSIGSHVKDEFAAGKLGQIVVCAFEEDSVVSAAGGAVMAVKGEYVNSLRGKRPSKYLRMPDMNAALGMVQLSNLEENCAKRRDILKVYQQSLSKTRHRQFGLNLFDFSSNACGFGILLDSKPDEAIRFAGKHDVPLRLAFDDSVAKGYDGDPFEAFPVASSYFYRTVEVPLYPFLRNSEIDGISKVVAHLP